MFLSSVQSGGARVGLEFRPKGVCVLTVTGVVTPEVLVEVMQQVVAVTAGAAAAWVVDYRLAVYAADLTFIDSVSDAVRPGDPWSRPIAIVSGVVDSPMWKMHARYAAGRGLIRRCFVGLGPACEWAEWFAVNLPGVLQAPLEVPHQSPSRTEQMPPGGVLST